MLKFLITTVLVFVSLVEGYSQDQSPFQLSNETFELKWLAPQTLVKEVGKYEKLELGLNFRKDIDDQINKFIKTNKDGINPFDPEDISVECTFISPTNNEKTIYGFYYTSFVPVGETWVEAPTKYDWRIRFAPDEIGRWSFSFKIKMKEKILYSVGTKFKCVPSSSKGILQRTYTGTNADRYLYLSETKQPFFAVGHNIAHSAYYKLTPAKAEQHKIWLTELAENGGNFFRLEMGAQNGLPDWENYKNYIQKMPQMWEYDRLVEHAQNLGLYFIMFRHHTEVENGESWDVSKWDNNPYKMGFDLHSRKEYFTNEEVLKWQKNNLRYIFSRWGYSTSFAFYEYQEIDIWIRELKKETGMNDKQAIALFKDWYVKQKEYIRSGLGYDRKLFINTYATTPDVEYSSGSDAMFANSDVIGFHKYGQNKDINYNDRYDKMEKLWDVWKKPLFVEEMGVNAATGSNFLPLYKCSDVEFHNAIWSTAFMGGAGTGLNWWWDRGIHDFQYYKDYKPLSAFFQNEELDKENYVPQKWHNKLSVNRAEIENFALVNENETRIIGWVHNATHYWRNIKSPDMDELLNEGQFKTPYKLNDGTIIGGKESEKTDFRKNTDAYTDRGGVQNVSGQTFEIKGLKKSGFGNKDWYQITFYSTSSNEKIIEQIQKTNLWGKLKLDFPESKNEDFSYKITYLGEGNQPPQ